MKTNLFKFKTLKKNKIVIEEETINNPFLLFFKKNKNSILIFLFLITLIVLLISTYYAVTNLKETTKIVTNINNVVVEFSEENTVNSINMKPITGGQAEKEFYERYGNIGLKEGIVLVVKEVEFSDGTITFYSDGSAKIVSDNTITRVSALENGEYGLKENGDIIIGAKTKRIVIEKNIVLEDGKKVIYYSDNSCEIITNNIANNLLVRNSERLIIENNRLIKITPSGVTMKKNAENINGYKITYYEDGTIKIEKGNNTYVIRNKEDFDFTKFIFPNNNQATIIENKVSLKDGSKIIYYTDGSAEIIKNNESIMVRQSKDIIYTENRIIEIIETTYALQSNEKTTPSGDKIIYLNNGGALIKNQNEIYSYVYENSLIKYDEQQYIKEILEKVEEKNKKTTQNGKIIINLEDGNSVIIDNNGYRIIKTDKIIYDQDGNIKEIEGEIKDKNNSVSENDFIIENKGNDDVNFIIAIELSDNYKEYAPIKLNPLYLRYNIVVDSNYLEQQLFDKKMKIGTVLQGGTKIEKETYILYEGKLNSGAKAEVNLGIWLDYDDITNDYQNSVFVGTIKVYSETIVN